jgi:hypothetical protein
MNATSTSSSSLDVAPLTRRRRVRQHALTALRVLLAIEFAGGGLMKLGGAESGVLAQRLGVRPLRMLRELAGSEDIRVWQYGADGQIVHDERRSREVRRALLGAVQQHTDELVGSWREESEAVRRAQLWLLSVLPTFVHRYYDLVDAVLPADYDELWRGLVAGRHTKGEVGLAGAVRRAATARREPACRQESWQASMRHQPKGSETTS